MDTLEEEPEVFRVNLWRNPMSQVRNPCLCLFTSLETLAHPLHFPLDRFFPAVQYVRIKVTLERNVWTGGFPRNGRFDTPVQPDHIVTAGLCDTSQRAVRSLGKKGEGNNRKPLGLQLLMNFGGDVLEGGQGELGEIMG